MKKWIGHTDGCLGGKCRGGCQKKKQTAEDIRSFTVDKSQIGRKPLHPIPKSTDFITFTGATKQGKSAAAMNWVERMGAKPGSIQFDIGSYMNEKEKELLEECQENYRRIRDEAITKRERVIEQARAPLNPMYEAYKKGKAERLAAIDNQSRNNWETLGRLLGAAYAAGEEEFDAFLEGIDRGRNNERQGRRAMGGPKP